MEGRAICKQEQITAESHSWQEPGNHYGRTSPCPTGGVLSSRPTWKSLYAYTLYVFASYLNLSLCLVLIQLTPFLVVVQLPPNLGAALRVTVNSFWKLFISLCMSGAPGVCKTAPHSGKWVKKNVLNWKEYISTYLECTPHFNSLEVVERKHAANRPRFPPTFL